MKFKKRFLMVFMSLTLLAGMLGGGTVAAEDEKSRTYSDLLGMSEEEISQLDLSNLQALVDYFAGLSENEAKKIDNQIVLSVCNAWNAKTSELSYSRTLEAKTDVGGLSIQSVYVERGVDKTLYSASVGDHYGTSTGMVTKYFNADVGFNRNQVEIHGYTPFGTGQVWAYTGTPFLVYGWDGSQMAYIRFNGFAYADVIGGFQSTASFKVTAEVYEAVGGTWSRIAYSDIYDLSTSGSWYDYGGYFNESLLVSMTAGKTYQVRLKTQADIAVPFGGATAYVAAYTPDYTMWTSIDIDWQ